jgi:small-conductance mechanosensitive channel
MGRGWRIQAPWVAAAGLLVWPGTAVAQTPAPAAGPALPAAPPPLAGPALPTGPVLPASPSAPSPSAPTAAPPSPPPSTKGTASGEPQPLADLPSQAVATRRMLREISGDLSPTLSIERVETAVPEWEREDYEDAGQTDSLLNEEPRFGELWQLNALWQYRRAKLDKALDVLAGRGRMLNEDLRRLDAALNQWRAALTRIDMTSAPAELRARVRATLDDLNNIRGEVRDSEDSILGLQNRVVHLQGVTDQVLRSIQVARERYRERMLRQDAPPLWANWRGVFRTGLTSRQVRATLSERWARLLRFNREHARSLWVRLVLLLSLWLVIRRFSRKVRQWDPADQEVTALKPFFQRPFALAFFVTLLSLIPVFPLAPTAGETLLVVLLCGTNLWLLYPVASPTLRPFLILPGLLLLVDRLRSLFEATPPEQYLLTLETGLAIAAVWWLIRRCWRRDLDGEALSESVLHLLWASLLGLGASLGASLLGFATLATVLGPGVVMSLFLATLLFGVVWIIRAVFRTSLLTNSNRAVLLPPSAEEVLYQRGSLLLAAAAIALWVLLTLDLFVARDLVVGWVSLVLTTPMKIHGFGITLGDVLLSVLVVVAAYQVSSIIRTILNDGVLPLVPLQRGMSHTISTLVYYAILCFGFVTAAAATGVNFDRLTLFASAFTVGLGFGLQNVVNNFVSGLILLFERPIQIGDTIELGPLLGRVMHIGMRSISVRTVQGAEVIVPNSNLINAQLINWTRSDTNRRVDLPVSVTVGPEPEQVVEILRSAALEQPQVLRKPAPLVLVTKLGKESLSFTLQCWIPQEQFDETQSALVTRISAALKAAEIEIV